MSAARQWLRPGARHAARLWALSALLLVLGATALWQAWSLALAVEAGQSALLALQQQRRVPAAPKPSKAALDLQRRWDALAAERGFNWYPVFRMLEASASEDIELLEFVPDKAGQRLVLRGEARDAAALTRYLALLSLQPGLGQVHLSHQKQGQRGTLPVLAFEVRGMLMSVENK